MVGMQFASPERRWRAVTAPLVAGVLGWVIALSFRLGYRPGAAPGLPLTVRLTVTGLAVVIGLILAGLIMRTHLEVDDEGLADRRLFKVVRLPWQAIVGFEVARPGSLWGGFCVAAICGDGTSVSLMATRAYSRVPSAQHLDELTRIRRSLEEAAAKRQPE